MEPKVEVKFNEEFDENILEESETYVVLDTTCNVCYAEFLDPDDLYVHIQQVHKKPLILKKLCHFCGATYTDFTDYANHIRDNHLTSLKICQYCSRAFRNLELKKKHEKKHVCPIKSTYSCSNCNSWFKALSELEFHELKQHQDCKEGVFLQPYYPHLSASLNIKASSLLHAIDSKTFYICVVCEHTSMDLDEYINHLKIDECKPYVCNNCSNVYRKKCSIIKHFQLHNECSYNASDIKPMEKCPECHELFECSLLKEHTKYCKTIKCTTCNLIFDSIQKLAEHQASKHPLAVSLNSCKFCSRECVGTIALENHVQKLHRKEFHLYKYRCVYCDNHFKHPQKLFAHFFTKHKDLEPFSCKICDKTFKLRKQLTIHIKLVHKSIGYVEFDENYNVFFTDTMSPNPFKPYSTLCSVDENESAKTSETPPKKGKFKKNPDVNLVNVNSDFMSATETEETRKKITDRPRKLTRKRKLSPSVIKADESEDNSSDDESLLEVRKKTKKLQNARKRLAARNYRTRTITTKKSNYVCKICMKNCFTYHNYQNHVSTHYKNQITKCVKCMKEFKSKIKLNEHIAKEHASSKLTETLKSLLEKRKLGMKPREPTMREKFMRTMKKVPTVDENLSSATITPIKSGLSVQTFIENFVPESSEVKKEIKMSNSITIKPVSVYEKQKEPVIKMKKFQPKPINTKVRLKMPVKFKEVPGEVTKVSVKIVHTIQNNKIFPSETYEHEIMNEPGHHSDYDQDDLDRPEIPEVAQEVMLDGTDETIKPVPLAQKIIIPKLPKDCKEISIAHLLPEAPFFKIVKIKCQDNNTLEIKDSKANLNVNQESIDPGKPDIVKLPDGTKLITVNPLAHLLGPKSVDEMLGPVKNKQYYVPKTRDFQSAFAKALMGIKAPSKTSKKKIGTVPVEQ